ncbi:MAG: hypothetical protein O2913_11240 [Chloroflexi bacterium]|nr:hypothetical protein [Chloroflexota bacterium]
MGRITIPRGLFLIVVTMAISVLAACGGSSATATATTVPATETPSAVAPTPTVSTVVPTPTNTDPSPTLAPTDLNRQLDGDSSGEAGPFTIRTGVMIVFVRYEGDGPLTITIRGSDNSAMTSVDSSSGPYQGERVHRIFDGNSEGLVPGEYMVEVEADGPWDVRLFQETGTSGQPATVTLAGKGDGGGSWLRLDDGEYTMTTSHAGAGGFIVELFDTLGLPPYRIVEATGAYQGEDAFTVGGGAPLKNPQTGFYAMGVQSEGDWEVTIARNDAP